MWYHIKMEKYCKTCDVKLEFVKGNEPWDEDHFQCPICCGTYNIFNLEKCDCKYAHPDGICRWPTLEGRLSQPLTTEKEALLQLNRIGGCELSEATLRKVEKYLEEDEQLKAVREKVKRAVDLSPNHVTFEDAKKQVENFRRPV